MYSKKIFYYLILSLYLFGCAVQGPISGGPIDESSPILLSVHPENFSTKISAQEKVTLNFDELIDPISVYSSITINNQDFKIKVKGKKIILYPSYEWDPDFLVDIYISRNLSDYQKNTLEDPLNLFYSLGEEIPAGTIHGQIIDIKNIINKYNGEDTNTFFQVGLFKILDSGKELIKKVDSNKYLEFRFDAIEEGYYSIAAVENKLIDINVDLSRRRYALLDSTHIFSNDTLSLKMNISDPISKQEISSINFINQYYVNYMLSDNTIEFGILDTIYNNFNQSEFSLELMRTSLILQNEFESYSTNVFEFIVPEVVDTIAPTINSTNIDEFNFSLVFSEPLEKFNYKGIFYILEDSNKVYIDYKFEDSALKNIINISLEQFIEDDISSNFSLGIEKNIIKDLYGNVCLDSVVIIDLGNQIITNKNIGTSKVTGKILYSKTAIPLSVALYNLETLEKTLVLSDKEYNFLFNGIQPGEYLLQCYENYDLNSEVAFPYFGGEWNSNGRTLHFSDIVGPIEVRANWDLENIILELSGRNKNE